ncbi:bifunctional UDP-N-acetylmuramoyl-tripeptide:D-alanyl-D-alanine ligase/alanine racemase [Cyclobacterium jeungdonense]|uniref:Alanine racemase n=1 Tax=Cyclobacterium jeungdonense TaxID=708087 RepID=A0ABT8CAA5_9BACT|nr:bifunctional UDP-N-acetylmuramoyl-tripeptide:D-alanyl-D-alanine ligase/alanine racemase [Cyclobacterium jeungdonense]MDN3689022.1 bifunctional UDP-N-acetylmuramoyl-tripeptide:D-alanyl-D-alanine ligase/alanine racemase [Cyclobacterium jeungdonense]
MIEVIHFHKFAAQQPGYFIKGTAANQIEQVSIDSRKIQNGTQTLFVALVGTRSSGWHFAKDAYHKNVRNFILPSEAKAPELLDSLSGANILFCAAPLEALQALAKLNREKFSGPVAGITGSNGKTIVKEWLAQVLSEKYRVWKSPKSYNSQIGVALSALGMDSRHQVALLEAGISKPGEMQSLEAIIQPELGIFTTIGSAHDEHFEDLETKIAEKCLLFARCKYIVYRKEHTRIHKYLEQHFPSERLISWSEQTGADYTLALRPNRNQTKILLIGKDLTTYTFTSSFRDPASLENIRHVIVSALILGMTPDSIQKGLDLLHAIDMRLTVKQGIQRCRIVDDSYNNDLAGLEIALEFMSHQRKPEGRKILILSEMRQEGNRQSVLEHTVRLLKHYQIDLFVGVGHTFEGFRGIFPSGSTFYPDTATLQQKISELNLKDDLILVKGARTFQFERIVGSLEAQVHETVLEINLNSIRHNFYHYKQKVSPGTKVMVMVKAFAYGSGSAEIGNYLQQIGADYLSVAYPDEGVYLRDKGVTLPIMVMNSGARHIELLLQHRLEPVVYEVNGLRALAMATREIVSIHLELDTGMRRLGLEEKDLNEAITLLQEHPNIRLAGLFSHLATADEAIHDAFSREQLALFERLSQEIRVKLPCRPLCHVLNSAGIIRYPEFGMDMVRLGIGLFGVEISQMEQEKLQPALTLKTVVSQVKTLKKGTTIGYGRKGVMAADGQIATLAIGYADGYDRRFSNGNAYVQIKGRKAATVGTICMDMCMVDVTGMEVREGDEAIIFGQDPSLQYLAEKIGTIPYELLTSIGRRVKRLYVLD